MADTAARLIEMAEDRLRVAEELGLSVTGLVARIYTHVDADEIDEACERLEAIDKLINEARTKAAGTQAIG